MSKEVYALALENALTEISNICPDVKSTFLFNEEANVIAKDNKPNGVKIQKVIGSMSNILEKTTAIGGLKSLVIEGNQGNLHISQIHDLYLSMATSKNADMKYVETVTRVLIPTVLKLLNSLDPTSLKQFPSAPILSDEEEIDEPEKKEDIDEELDNETEEPEKKEKKSKSRMDAPSNQLIVERFGGFLVRGDTVQISESIINQWEEDLDGEEFSQVEIEAFNGHSKQCKVKKMNDSKLENESIIRIPDKICDMLNVKKGELVRVKPLIM